LSEIQKGIFGKITIHFTEKKKPESLSEKDQIVKRKVHWGRKDSRATKTGEV